jgi:hypothetical protein
MLYPFELRAQADFILPAAGSIPNLASAEVFTVVFLPTLYGAIVVTKVSDSKAT